MLIVKRIKHGPLKGYTIRKSKNGWYDVYSSNGVSQSTGKLENIEAALLFIKQKLNT